MIRKKNYILIDSRDRNTRIYEEPNEYVIELNDVIKNIFNVKLVYALYPKHGTEFYTNLHIEEFAPNAISNNRYLADAFTQLPMISYFNEYRSELSDKKGKSFEDPIPKLSKLTIKYQSFDGTMSVMGEHFLKFEVEYYIFDGIPEMNIYKHPITPLEHKVSRIFVELNPDYTSDDLVKAYKKMKKKVSHDDTERRKELKMEVVRLHNLIN